jgi:predicted hotdog family 3-hydroxylacyl-ACP dehydratase
VQSAGWYLDERGYMPAWIGIELMAQAVAAHAGLRGWLAGKPPKPGVLLGSRLYRVGASRVAAGTLLRITARVSYADESGFGAYDCAIRDGSAELATATLKVYEPDDAEAFFRTMADQR